MTDTITLPRDLVLEIEKSMKQVAYLLEYQFTGSRQAMTALQRACDAVDDALPKLMKAALAAPQPEPQPVKQAQQCGKRIRDLALDLEKTGRIISCLTVDDQFSIQERTDMVARNRGIQCAMEDAINELVELAARGGDK